MARVKYKNSPLKEVIFQLRFPTILSINAKEPVEFQERLRDEYPLYNDTIETVKESLPNGDVKETPSHRYQFISQDGLYMISLGSSFIALSTLGYDTWEKFRDRIEKVVEQFQEVYSTKIFVRIGLRYKDVITKSVYGFAGRNWNELVKPEVIGIISNIDEQNLMEYHLMSVHRQKGDDSVVRNQFEFVLTEKRDEVSLLLDCDYSLSQVLPAEKYLGVADTLHGHSSNFIENSITPALREAMQPVPIQ